MLTRLVNNHVKPGWIGFRAWWVLIYSSVSVKERLVWRISKKETPG